MSQTSHGRKRGIWSLTAENIGLGWELCKSVYKVASRSAAHDGSSTSVKPWTIPIPRFLEPEPPAPPLPRVTQRAEDRIVEEPRSPEGVRTVVVASAFFVAFAAGIGFMFVYWTGGSNLLLGATLALALGGLGSGLVLWAHLLMAHREAIEPREAMPSPREDRKAIAEDFNIGEHEVQRRKLLKTMGAVVAGTFAALVISLLRSFGRAPEPAILSPVWKRGQRLITVNGQPVSANTLNPGDAVTVFPEGSVGSVHAQTVLVRVREEFLRLPRDRANWAPMGYLAYSRVCTHAGCPVGEYEASTDLLLCPCHQSTFNVLDGAQPTSGPAARALPQLPLYVASDGTLRAAGDFSAPPGPGFWRLPS